MIRPYFITVILAAFLVIAPWAAAQQPQAIYVHLDLSQVRTIKPLVGDLANHANELEELNEVLEEGLPAWDFVAGTASASPRLTITLKPVGSFNKPEQAQVDADVELKANEFEGSIPLCTALTLYKPAELLSVLPYVSGGEMLDHIVARFHAAFQKVPHEQRWPIISSRVPIGSSFVSFKSPKTVLLPWPWESFRQWSLSRFKTQCRTAKGVTILISEASGVGTLHTPTGTWYVAAEHIRVQPFGGPEEPADKHLRDLPHLTTGAIYVTHLERNSVFDVGGNVDILP